MEWTRYLWTHYFDNDGGKRRRSQSKLAYIVNHVANAYYVGVGYEDAVLPPDEPCSANYDNWCSLTNVQSLVGRAQFEVSKVSTREDWEELVHRVNFDPDYVIEGGFYLFLYNMEKGKLLAHGKTFDRFSDTAEEICLRDNNGTAGNSPTLHELFSNATSEQSTGWVKYNWRKPDDDIAYQKIALTVRITFDSEDYVLEAGFRHETQEYPTGPRGESCDESYNTPCSSRTAHQLSSHTLVHLLAEDGKTTMEDRLAAVSEESEFKPGSFYAFVFNRSTSVCSSHGQTPSFVGLTLSQIIEHNIGSTLDVEALHQQFSKAAERGGAIVLYDWANASQKICHIFRINEDLYGGVGYYNTRYPLDLAFGKTMRGDDTPCSSRFNQSCSQVNARAILGNALAELVLASSEPISMPQGRSKKSIGEVFTRITNKGWNFFYSDFAVSVSSFGNHTACQNNDGSGCTVANGANPSYIGLTWNETLQLQGEFTTKGDDLHHQLMDKANEGGGFVRYHFLEEEKVAWVSRFHHEGESYYVLVEYMNVESPPTCDNCGDDLVCTAPTQQFCLMVEVEPDDIVALSVVLAVGCMITLFCVVSVVRCWAKLQRMKRKVPRSRLQITEGIAPWDH